MAIRYSKTLPLITFGCDLFVLNLALQCAHLLIFKYYSSEIQSNNFILLVNLVWVTVASLTHNYVIKRPLVATDNINKFLSSLLYHLVVVLIIIYFFKMYKVSRGELVFTYVLFLAFMIIERSIFFFTLDYVRKKGYNNRNILIVGDEDVAKLLIRSFSQHPEFGYDLSSFISEDMIRSTPEPVLFQQLLNKNPDEIFICYKNLDSSFIQKLIGFGEDNNIKVKIVPDLLLNNAFGSIIHYDQLPVIDVSSNIFPSKKVLILKRGFDMGFASIMMITGLPAFLLIALITKLSSKGPVFYVQERIGKNQKPFKIYKFRSMYVNSELAGPQLSSDLDPRITKWGRIIRKSRLDELPQFWNVLKGDMSVVGPRPERQYFIEQLIERSPNYKRLLKLKPGVTSMGQVNYGYAEDIDQMRDRIRYDLLYLKNVNLNSDMGIIFKTIKVMAQFKGK